MEWVRLHHESATGRDGYSDFYKKDLSLSILDIACSDGSALNDHEFVDVTLSEVTEGVKVYLF
jgi:hypothetical protein